MSAVAFPGRFLQNKSNISEKNFDENWDLQVFPLIDEKCISHDSRQEVKDFHTRHSITLMITFKTGRDSFSLITCERYFILCLLLRPILVLHWSLNWSNDLINMEKKKVVP